MKEEKNEIIRAGCFVGEKQDPKALCAMPDCRFAQTCIWKKEKVPNHLGSDNNHTEAMGSQVR